jgi:sec-independent protein translocase protein TatB
MLDFSWSHILLLMIVALVVVGPKDLPRLMRIVGQWMGKARAMANEFRKSFDDMARQSELDELRKEIENLRHANPLADVQRDLNRSIIPDEMRSANVMTSTVPPPPTVSLAAEPEEVETQSLPEPGPEPRDGEFEVTTAPITSGGYTPPHP